MNKIFITGADGFVGQHLCAFLKFHQVDFIPFSRKINGELENLNSNSELLTQAHVIVHLAGRAHIMNETALDPLTEFTKSNVTTSFQLAQTAKKAGVKKFIYMSSIKVNGEQTYATPFKADDIPKPTDAYAVSKFEAEKALLALHEKNVFEVIIIRPPLIYGPGVKANFALLMKLVKWPVPLPFALVNNKRSLISVLNLADLILKCSKRELGQNSEIFLVADKMSYSLKQILIHLSQIQSKKIWLFPFPVFCLKIPFLLFKKHSLIDRLFGDLEIDSQKTKILLNWEPPYTFNETFSFFKEQLN